MGLKIYNNNSGNGELTAYYDIIKRNNFKSDQDFVKVVHIEIWVILNLLYE